MIEYSAQVNNMCPITKGPKHGPAPIPEEGEWVKAYKIEDIARRQRQMYIRDSPSRVPAS